MNRNLKFYSLLSAAIFLSIGALALSDNSSSFRTIDLFPLVTEENSLVKEAAVKNNFNTAHKIAKKDSLDLLYPLEDQPPYYQYPSPSQNPFDLPDPSVIQHSVNYDPATNEYILTDSIGGQLYGNPTYLSLDEYMELQNQQAIQQYWNNQSSGAGAGSIGGGDGGIVNDITDQAGGLLDKTGDKLLDKLQLPSLPKSVSDLIDIRPSGSVVLNFYVRKERNQNPNLSSFQRNSPPQFGFDMDIPNFNLNANIGDKLKMNMDYSTLQTFNFNKQIKLEYTGDEDQIIQRLEAGATSFQTPTTLIPSNSSLFGLQAKLKFGRLTMTNVLASQRSSTEGFQIDNGGRRQTFDIEVSKYEVNNNFLLAHHFRENFNTNMFLIPNILPKENITRIEVWVTNRSQSNPELRDIVALSDLGEARVSNFNNTSLQNPSIPANSPPDNKNNNLINILNNPTASNPDVAVSILTQNNLNINADYVQFEGKRLDPNLYDYDPGLGTIFLNYRLEDDDVLAVSYEYADEYGIYHQVGEFANEKTPSSDTTTINYQNNTGLNSDKRVIFMKMLKTRGNRPELPLWDLMMKNVYRIPNAYKLEAKDFRIDVFYKNPGMGMSRYLPDDTPESINGEILIKLLNLDRLNLQKDPCPDGLYDYIENYTIHPKNGRIMFPVLEPFGANIREKLQAAGATDAIVNKYTFSALYDNTYASSLQHPDQNRYYIKGEFKSTITNQFNVGSFNLSPGDVIVTAGAKVLKEGEDYTIDYSSGRMTLTSEGYLEAGIPIKIQYKDNSGFGFNEKGFLGSRLDYAINDNFNLGATFVSLNERPFTPKTNVGEDPISNKMLGFDMRYFKEAPAITKVLDKLPLYSTKEPSSFNFYGEVAAFFPGHARALGDKGFVFIDDFEGSNSPNTLESPISDWAIAATPQTDLFPESTLINDWAYGFNRASLSLYKIDIRNWSIGTFPHNSINATRKIGINEIFPARTAQVGNNIFPTFDIYYDPTERGPYNFDTSPSDYSAGLGLDGKLLDPKSRWGGISKRLNYTTDFESANVKYIEFWLMDPSVDDPGNPGELYFNLGNIAEDVLKDGRKFFENGLPGAGQIGNTDETIWSRIPNNQIISNYFDTNEANRIAQDVGFDGVNNELELVKFDDYISSLSAVVYPEVIEAIKKDPSNDDFVSFISSQVDAAVPIYERYKRWLRPQGNSPVLDSNDDTAAAMSTPDMEDLNRDNTLETNEAFFEYKIELHDNMDRNDPYIADIREGEFDAGDGVMKPYKWLKYKIPIEEFTSQKGNIQNFRNIQFMRMYLTNFEKPVILRLGDLQLVANRWRTYDKEIVQPGLYMPDDNGGQSIFNLTAVNLEENGVRTPVPYVIPPGVQREQQNNTNQNIQLNEQALSLEVCGLADGHARAAFKNQDPALDARFYKRLQCWVSAQNLNLSEYFSQPLEDNAISAFIRIGDDFTQNYYEYELPLKISDDVEVMSSLVNTYNNTDLSFSERDEALNELAKLVWPTENFIDIELEKLVEAKKSRNYREEGLPDYTKPYTVYYDTLNPAKGRITIVGAPDLGRAPVIMLGVRNPKASQFNPNNDGLSKCAEVWFNELRLYDFEESPSVGALARLDIKLADLATVTMSGDMHTAGFGNLEQKINERYRDNFYKYDMLSNISLDKFLPASSGIKIPMIVNWTEQISNPEYDPYETDLKVQDKVRLTREKYGEEAAKKVKKNSQDYESTKNISFANVRKVRAATDKAQVYDIENWEASYSYTKIDSRDPGVEYEKEKRHKFSLGYNYTTKPNYLLPFKQIKSKSGYLKIIKDINFNFIPSTISFVNDLNRRTITTQLRELTFPGVEIDPNFAVLPTYNKNFVWDRRYGYRHDITKALNLDYTAVNSSRIDEPCGPIVRDQMWDNIKSLGRNLNFRQTTNVNYTIPIEKIPLFDWTQTKIKYSTTFEWITGPLPPKDAFGNDIDSLNTKNIILNDRNWTIDGELSFKKLYAKIPYLKKVDNYKPGSPKPKKDKDKNAPDVIDPANPNAPAKPKPTPGTSSLSLVERLLVQPLLSLKKASLTYTNKKGTRIPGFNYRNQYLGQNFDAKAPGFDFIFGAQPDSLWLENAAQKGWITNNPNLNDQVVQKSEKNISGKASFEPWKEVKLDLNWNLINSLTHSERFKANEAGTFNHLAKMDVGTYTITFLPLKTLFEKIDTQYISETFVRMQAYRPIISERLGLLNDNSNGDFEYFPAVGDSIPPIPFDDYSQGYGPYSQEVLIPSFIAAYTRKDPNKVKLNPTRLFPRPNWKLTYNGLNKLSWFKDYFTSISVSHGYNSTLSISRFQTNPDFTGTFDDMANYPMSIDTLSGNFYNRFTINDVVISEKFNPLIGVDFKMKNGVLGNFNMAKSRNLALNFSLPQLIEMRTTEFTFGAGYRLTGIKTPLKIGKKTIKLDNEMNFKLDFSYKDLVTINHKFDELPEVTIGSTNIRIEPSINYLINNKLKAEIYYIREHMKAKTSAQAERITHQGGVRLTFTLTQ